MATPPTRGKRGSGFGMRVHPIDGTYRMHYGEDGIGEGNYAPVTGTVVFAGYDTTGHGFGWTVGIREAANPTVIWWIAHHGTSASVNPLRVSVGSNVVGGVTYLGPSGTTGAATGRHAHTERRVHGGTRPGQGTATDPRLYYTGTSGGGGTPFPEPEEVRKKNVTTVYMKDGSSPALVALAGDGQGDAAWIEMIDVGVIANIQSIHGNAIRLSPGTWDSFKAKYQSGSAASGGLTTAQNAALMGLPAAVADLPTNGELGQALTSTVALVNDHADDNKDAIIAAMPTSSGGGSSSYNLSLTIDEIPGTATGTATAN